jgi:hypothetical protein
LSPEFWKNALIGLPIAIVALLGIAAYAPSAWLFVVAALIGWSITDLIFHTLEIQPVINWIGFVGFVLLVALLTGVAALFSNWLLSSVPQTLSSTQLANQTLSVLGTQVHLDWLISVLIVNTIATALAFVD